MSATDALVMVDETQPAQNVEAGQVKFTKDNESIDMNGEQKLIGLTKEQLERYRNDPLWKPIRYTLFVLFWLLWIAMFAGAILIVVMSPKCAKKKEVDPSNNAVTYQIYTPTFRDTDGDGVGDLNGIKEKLNDLRRVGVTTIWPTPLLTTHKDTFDIAETLNPLEVNPQFGTENDLKALINRAHDLNLRFIADLPLTISTDRPEANKQGIGGTGKVRLLNLVVPEALASVKKTAAKLISLGVDGLNFAQYGYKYPAGSVDTARLDDLAKAIRQENKDTIRGAEKFIFISDSVSERPSHSIDFHVRSLGRFPGLSGVCSNSADFIDCLKDSAQAGAAQIKKNASSLPMWQLGDVSHARADSLYGPIGNQSTQANSLVTAIQLFLPGPVKVFYGEELGLPSISQPGTTVGPQFGLMQWDPTNKGFTESADKLFFKSIPETDAADLNFKSQYDATHSHLKVFKKLANLRVRDEVFTDGDFKTGKIDGLHVFLRTLAGDEKAYILVANWPTATDKGTKQFATDHITKAFQIKAAGAELLIDHPLNVKNEWQIKVDTKLTLEPYEFVLVRVEVLA